MFLDICILICVFALGRLTSGKFNRFDVYNAVDDCFIDDPHLTERFIIHFMKSQTDEKTLSMLVESHRLKVIQRAIKDGKMVVREEDGKIILKNSDKKSS